MKPWIPYPLTLKGKTVTLHALEPQAIDALLALAADKRIWRHYAVDGSDTAMLGESLNNGIAERTRGLQYPFTIYHNTNSQVIGSTRFLELQPVHRKLEIGWTWLHPDFWGTGVNTECKLLLLTHAFEQMQALRVQLKTDVKNERSKKAIEKIGAKQEGVFRNDMVKGDGTSRTSVYYSIVAEEWQAVKQQLTSLQA